MIDALLGLGFMLLFEGVIYAFSPSHAKKIANYLIVLSPQKIRIFGVVTTILGIGMVWMVYAARV
jgi:uncharacterized protein YjeT (DUF2065 family)